MATSSPAHPPVEAAGPAPVAPRPAEPGTMFAAVVVRTARVLRAVPQVQDYQPPSPPVYSAGRSMLGWTR
jgi:hypothetical protein